MATIGGYNVVTDGLVLSLDAANRRSYVSGSSVWNDLSGNRNSGSLVNGPTFDSANGGSIVFDGANDSVNCGTSNDLKFLNTGSYTIEVVIKQAVTQSGFPIFVSNDPITPTRDGLSLIITSTSIQVERWVGATGEGGGSISRVNNPDLGIGVPIHVAATYNGSQGLLYANNRLGTPQTSTLAFNTVSSPFSIGSRGLGTGNYFNGSVYLCRVYNRALSAAEIAQNYNATKARFGL